MLGRKKRNSGFLTFADFWQRYMLTDISGELCRDYVKWRVGQPWRSSKPEKTNRPARIVTEATARRELEDLRAAINHHIGENRCSQVDLCGAAAKIRPEG